MSASMGLHQGWDSLEPAIHYGRSSFFLCLQGLLRNTWSPSMVRMFLCFLVISLPYSMTLAQAPSYTVPWLPAVLAKPCTFQPMPQIG